MSRESPPARHAALLAELRKFIAGVITSNQRIAEHFNLNPSDLLCFDILEVTGVLTPTQLAAHTGLTSGGVTVVLDRLESARLIKREPNPRDRRSVLVRPTDDGLQRLRRIYARMHEDLEKQLAHYNVKTLDVLIGFFQQANKSRAQRTFPA